MIWFKDLVQAAGFSRKSAGTIAFALATCATIAGYLVFEVSQVEALGITTSVGLSGVVLEWFQTRSRTRQKAIIQVWPELIDSLISALTAGASLDEGLADVAENGPELLRPMLSDFVRDMDSGRSFRSSVNSLKQRFGNRHADELFQMVILVSEAGGDGILSALRRQARLVRVEIATLGELESRLSWITGTAKIAVAAPWIVVTLLCTRSENVAAYSSVEGTAILLFGLLVCVFAYQILKGIGRLPMPVRVFA